MLIIAWNNFSKRKNSTKQPNDADGTKYTVYLKEDTSIEAPTFILDTPLSDITYVEAMGHYYFVDDVININASQCEVRCSQDVLASYKTAIQATTQFIERAAMRFDTYIPDPYVTIKNGVDVSVTETSTGTLFDSTGCYVVSVLNNKGSGAGFTTYYIMSVTSVAQLAAYCNANLSDSTSISDIVAWLQATFLKTADAVIDCKWLPISYNYIGSSGLSFVGETVRVGKDDVAGVGGLRLTSTAVASSTYTIANIRSLCRYKDDFRVGSPYTKAFIYIPFYGMYNFNLLDFETNMQLKFDIDIATGDCTCFISDGSKLVTTLNYNMAVTCPVGKVGNEAGGVISSTLGTAGGIAGAIAASTGIGVATGAIAATVSASNAISAASAISPSVRGSQQGRSMIRDGLSIKVVIITLDTTPVSSLSANVGRPLNTVRSLSDISGYVKCSDASIDINGRSSDRDAINSLLNSGIFIE